MNYLTVRNSHPYGKFIGLCACRSRFISRQNTRTIVQYAGLAEPRLSRYVLGICRFWKIDRQQGNHKGYPYNRHRPNVGAGLVPAQSTAIRVLYCICLIRDSEGFRELV